MYTRYVWMQFYCSFSTTQSLYIVMEYAPGGDLATLLKYAGALDECEARRYFAETVLAGKYMGLGIPHPSPAVGARSFSSDRALPGCCPDGIPRSHTTVPHRLCVKSPRFCLIRPIFFGGGVAGYFLCSRVHPRIRHRAPRPQAR